MAKSNVIITRGPPPVQHNAVLSGPGDNPPTEHHQHHHHPQKLLHFNVGFIMANKYFTIRLPVRRTALESNIVPGHRDGRGKEPTQSAEIHRQQRHQGSGYL